MDKNRTIIERVKTVIVHPPPQVKTVVKEVVRDTVKTGTQVVGSAAAGGAVIGGGCLAVIAGIVAAVVFFGTIVLCVTWVVEKLGG